MTNAVKTAATSKDDVLPDSELDNVVGGLASSKMGPSHYEKKNVTTIRWSPLAGAENDHE